MRWLSRCHSPAASWLRFSFGVPCTQPNCLGSKVPAEPATVFPIPQIFSTSPLVKHRHRASCASEALEECSTHSVMPAESQTRLHLTRQGDSCLIDNRWLTTIDLRPPRLSSSIKLASVGCAARSESHVVLADCCNLSRGQSLYPRPVHRPLFWSLQSRAC